MRCPKCQFDHRLQTTECLKCGIVFSKYKPPVDAPEIPALSGAVAKQPDAAMPSNLADERMAAAVVSSFVASLDRALSPEADHSPAAIRKAAATEFKYRLLALPLALLVARLIAGTSLRVAAGMLAMVLHESGHAITAWLAGHWAVPLLWVTMHGEERSWSIVLFLSAAIIFGGFLAWKMEKWGWVCAAGALLILQITILSAHHDEALIVFFGDGGAMVLASILMATFYAPRESALYKNSGLRWGLLAIGALTFMYVYRLWSGPIENLPFGEIEGVNLSDPSLLTQMYGWNLAQLIGRYLLLANVCFAFLFVLYVWGLVSAILEMRSPGTLRWPVAAKS
ncbi:MAG TPA: hypothetical protein VK709_06460 [Candidatus Saccharimonadales bacterium]|nr:hypothetical protein [Candidatus Saccharimonadales bacterium]